MMFTLSHLFSLVENQRRQEEGWEDSRGGRLGGDPGECKEDKQGEVAIRLPADIECVGDALPIQPNTSER